MNRDALQGESGAASAGDALPARPLLERLESADPAARIAALRAAADDPAAVVYIDAISRALGDTDLRVGRAASDALTALSRQHDVQSALKRQLHGASAQARWGAAFTLSRIAPPEPALLPAAIEAFASPSGDVRWAAARLVVDMGRLHDDVLPVTLALAAPTAAGGESIASAVRRMALFCLRELAPDEPAVADAVLRSLRETTQSARGRADADTGELRRAALTCAFGLTGLPGELAELSDALAAVVSSDTDPQCQSLAALVLAEWATRSGTAPTGEARQSLERALRQGADATLRDAAERALAVAAPPAPPTTASCDSATEPAPEGGTGS